MVVPAALRRTRTSAAVVEYVQREIFAGSLRHGDRIDVERIGTALGVSPTPVREALVLLERDGLIATRMHRVAIVAHFDAGTLRADFHVLGVLSGVAAARVAKDRDPRVLARLQDLLQALADSASVDSASAGGTSADGASADGASADGASADGASADGRADAAVTGTRTKDLVAEIVQLQHDAGATPRLLAELQGVGGFLAWAARESDRRTPEEVVEAQRRVVDAIVAGHSQAAARARLADARAAAEEVIGELIRRGVLRADGTNAAG
ncbi:GntR family transcriptional regulator [Frankia sp. R43]|uniref:GntR family transcriptional regulator n=1 Tax=Frankia sp. R43 TaxID=269536 RepID=UPI0006CA0493|nr:GntR family transcriptional regulator [Frankia sp. R43]KPM52385.1 GntR family transcriptional regulator [Frankia sp. R43]